MTIQTYRPEWLTDYASDDFKWHLDQNSGRNVYTRRLGIVESLFDVDGVAFEGRADLNCDLKVEFRSNLPRSAIREHISLAWAVLRQKHVLMSTRAASSSSTGKARSFVYRQPSSQVNVIEEARRHVTYLEDHHETVEAHDFYQHLMNSSRAIEPEQALARLIVYPFKPAKEAPFRIDFVFVLAHQITDGLTLFRWVSSFIDLLNLDNAKLGQYAESLAKVSAVDRLPPPQEELYHPISGSIARQRWFWAIARILRHVKRAPPEAFPNPLRRSQPLTTANTFPSKYGALSYDRVPPLNNYAIAPTLGRKSTERLAKLCRQAKISIGSGLFTLVAIVMMQFEEERHPDIAPEHRRPFVGSFPINPRPFLAGASTTGKEDSLMLAFSDGITLPFLPKNLPFEGRFRLLGKQAHRQLKQYQKRPRTAEEELTLGSRSPRQLLPSLYMGTLERLEKWRRPEDKQGFDIQGAYPAALGTLATCGISSVGDRTQMVAAGKYDTSRLDAGQEVVADFRHINSAVRARDGEFLCGAASDKEKTYFMISVDSCAIDRRKAEEFKTVIESILEQDDDSVMSKL